jgi:hypothetical protein
LLSDFDIAKASTSNSFAAFTCMEYSATAVPDNMSDFQKAFAKSRLARLAADPPPMLEEDDGEETIEGEESPSKTTTVLHHDDDSSSASSASSTGTIIPSPRKNLFASLKGCVFCSPSFGRLDNATVVTS